jgi:endonuclease YncB( thermonuclease family)
MRVKVLSRIAASLAAVLLLTGAGAPSALQQVVAVHDGDTLTVLEPGGARVRVRLFEIDSPERGQPWADEARAVLRGLVANKYVRVESLDTDQYGRSLARVFRGELEVNRELVRRGAAWVYRSARNDSLRALEQEARGAKRGLWALPEAERVPPWEWRRSHGRHERAGDSKRALRITCGSKTKCSEMTSCEEARRYLERCGETRFDGDGDGVPCRSLCR